MILVGMGLFKTLREGGRINILRFFATPAENVSSSKLAQLRKNTGFTLINCRKALQLNDNDLTKSEEWLKAEAKRLGWEKAVKLQTRTAQEGLIAVAKTKNSALMVEMNCETDFVAKNDKFKSLIELAVITCLAQNLQKSYPLNKKILLKEEELLNFVTSTDEKLSDSILKCTGEIGEKIVLRRAMYFQADNNVHIDVEVHPPDVIQNKEILTGKYGSFVAWKKNLEAAIENQIMDENLGVNLCKHVIGMNPKEVGKPQMDVVHDDPRKEDEVLLNQEYILDPEITVEELLEEQGAEVIDFHRFHVGEDEIQVGEPEAEHSELVRQAEPL